MRRSILVAFLILLPACAQSVPARDATPVELVGTIALFTPVPTLDVSVLDEKQLGILNIQPQPWKVADNRVYAFVHVHDYLDGSLLALGDGSLSAGELEQIGQLSANAEAGMYRQGDHALFWIAEEIDRLTYLAVTGEMAAFEEGVRQLKRGIPARPDPGE